MLFIFLINSQGVFIEHHEAVSCEDVSFGPGNVERHQYEHQSCNSHSCSSEHQEINISSKNTCDIYDFENTDHQNDCACFADYFQIPVLQIESKAFNLLPDIQLVFLNQINNLQAYIKQEGINNICANAPPNKHYRNISTQIVNCTFLC